MPMPSSFCPCFSNWSGRPRRPFRTSNCPHRPLAAITASRAAATAAGFRRPHARPPRRPSSKTSRPVAVPRPGKPRSVRPGGRRQWSRASLARTPSSSRHLRKCSANWPMWCINSTPGANKCWSKRLSPKFRTRPPASLARNSPSPTSRAACSRPPVSRTPRPAC
ncbi:hypothetical protein D9M73_121150 [compost metagenome]